jgi:hypothetical protein
LFGIELGEEFAGGFGGLEGAVIGAADGGFEGEESGASVLQELLTIGVEMAAGGSEQDEFPTKANNEFAALEVPLTVTLG